MPPVSLVYAWDEKNCITAKFGDRSCVIKAILQFVMGVAHILSFVGAHKKKKVLGISFVFQMESSTILL